MGLRRRAREMALQVLYQSELTDVVATDVFEQFCDNFEFNKKAIPYGRQLVYGVTQHLEDVNGLIKKHAVNWRIERMSMIDKCILRIAVFEMIHLEQVPESVAINEALEIARRYSTDEAVPFINGILDAIHLSLKKTKD
ncbi:MAG: transcription antitermination factor NusB [Proteobacteria bacterium]|nr:transcription antitermination factor NusB [Pseudomonadota bacterium]MBU1710186.1 transcription antitermination factor NusB [Pseudomonadota bacterium]